MPRRPSLVLALGLLIALSPPARAATVVVPDNYPTIQAAIDGGADVIQVRDGLVPERLIVARSVVIEPGPAPPYHAAWAPMPLIQSLDIPRGDRPSWDIQVRGVRFLGHVTSGICEGSVTFESCRFDSGLAGGCQWFESYGIRGCLFLGPVDIAGYVQFAGNTVIGGKVSIWADGNHDIRNNYIQGPAEVGLDLSLDVSAGSVTMNTIRGTNTGIRSAGGWTRPFRNDVADCSDDGIVFMPSIYLVQCDSNRVVHCGGAGIVVRSDPQLLGRNAEIKGNVVEATGQSGIWLGPAVIGAPISGNVVLDAGGDGITVGDAYDLQHNIVGRSRGAGIRIDGRGGLGVADNTIFSNGAAGIQVVGESYPNDSFFNNISVLNSGPGFSVELTGAPYTGPPTLGCNDWFQNAGGAVKGTSPGSTDLQLNPLFCDLPSADVHLASNSPLLAAAGCGLIGARGEGCVATAAVESPTTPTLTRFRAWPVPAKGAVAFEIPASAAATVVEVFDVTGARRWQTDLPAGATRLEWDRRDGNGRTAAPGVYFARLRRADAEVATTRIVLAE